MKHFEDVGQLLQAVREGNADALEQLIERYRPILWRYLRLRARNEQDAEDVLQETLLRVARALPHVQLEVPLDHWLFRVATNCLRTYYERTSPRNEVAFSQFENLETILNLQQDSPEPSLIEQIADEQIENQLIEIVHAVCSPAERQVLRLVIQDERLETVALLLHMNQNTVRSHLMRARAKVLAHIIQHCPQLVGGQEGIQQAVNRLQANARPKERLNQRELHALENPERNQEWLRKACLKLAKYLKLR